MPRHTFKQIYGCFIGSLGKFSSFSPAIATRLWLSSHYGPILSMKNEKRKQYLSLLNSDFY